MGFLGQGFSNCGSHKATWQQLNDTHTHNTHTVPRAGRYTKINSELRYCSVRFSDRKGRLRVLKRGRARVVITEGLRATVHY